MQQLVSLSEWCEVTDIVTGLAMNFLDVAERVYNLPPKAVLRKVVRRLKPGARAAYDLDEILSSPKFVRPQRPVDFLTRYQKIICRETRWRDLEFELQDVFEIGCGPLLGWAPLAIFLGCESYTCIEPAYNSALMASQRAEEVYFLPVHKDLTAVYGPLMTFSGFMSRLRERVIVKVSTLADAHVDGDFGIVLSNSCLEHIGDLPKALSQIFQLSRSGGRFLHLVDFGSHRPGRNPFTEMYAHPPSEYRRRYGSHLNLHRPPEVLRMFEEAGFSATLIPYYSFAEYFTGEIDDYWLTRFSREDLFIKAAIVAGSLNKITS